MATPEQLGLRHELLTGVPAIYQLIHTTGKRQALHLEDHLVFARNAYRADFPECFASQNEQLSIADVRIQNPHPTLPIPDLTLLQERIETILF